MQGRTALIDAALNGHLAVVLLLAEVEDWNLEGVMVKAFDSRDARRREQVIALLSFRNFFLSVEFVGGDLNIYQSDQKAANEGIYFDSGTKQIQYE